MMLVVFALVFAAPAALFTLAAKGIDRLCGVGGPRRRSRRPSRRTQRTDLQRYGRDLARLAAEHEQLLGSEQHSTAFRLRTVDLAYDDVLREACRSLELDVPGRPMNAVERLQTEAELVVRGVSW